jgi:asparagine synthase (glutamine-hydrolysing)
VCGICGSWNLNNKPADPALLVKMRDIMSHRGPDGAGCVLFNSHGSNKPIQFQSLNDLTSDLRRLTSEFDIGLGHRRLSIIDLNTGDQPMSNEDGSIWIVFNGEIYNYKELRTELQGKGHVFRTTSDTEVIIHSYEQYGEDCPTKFNGIFAFGIWDARKRKLFLARDHFGVKPLYYCQHHGTFYFGSELKAILSDPDVPREMDLDALNLCLTFRHTPSPWTLFKGIHKLPPGSSLQVTSQGPKQQRYWNGSEDIDRARSESEWIEQLRGSLEKAVAGQMVSDVPIGLSLSSGVDSNTLLALMSQHSGGPVKAFTVGFAGKEDSSEIEPARLAAGRFGAEFYDQIISLDDYASFMNRYLWHLEEPIGNESAAAYYFVAKMAQEKGVKVLLNGQGADEAFAGYERYLGVAYEGWLHLGTIPPFRWIVPYMLAGSALGERYQRFLFASAGNDEADRFRRVYSILSDEMMSSLLNPDIAKRMDPELPKQYIKDQLSSAPEGTPLERMTYVDLRTSLPDNLLLCEDKMSMAASVEARVPLLDLEYMRIAEQIPGKLKLRGIRDKYIHRKVCEHWVGKETMSRRKIGFDNAMDLWLKGQLGNLMMRMLKVRGSFADTFLNSESVSKLMREHAENRRDHQRILFLLFSLESWYEVFFQGKKRSE